MKLRNILTILITSLMLAGCPEMQPDMLPNNPYVTLTCEQVVCTDTIAEVESKNSDEHTIQCVWQCNDNPTIYTQAYSRTVDGCFELVADSEPDTICEYGIKATQPF